MAVADFVPLTVAGQRWFCTIFPDHRWTLRFNLASNSMKFDCDPIATHFVMSSLMLIKYCIGRDQIGCWFDKSYLPLSWWSDYTFFSPGNHLDESKITATILQKELSPRGNAIRRSRYGLRPLGPSSPTIWDHRSPARGLAQRCRVACPAARASRRYADTNRPYRNRGTRQSTQSRQKMPRHRAARAFRHGLETRDHRSLQRRSGASFLSL